MKDSYLFNIKMSMLLAHAYLVAATLSEEPLRLSDPRIINLKMGGNGRSGSGALSHRLIVCIALAYTLRPPRAQVKLPLQLLVPLN